jgi:hypothetical protein
LGEDDKALSIGSIESAVVKAYNCRLGHTKIEVVNKISLLIMDTYTGEKKKHPCFGWREDDKAL